MKKRKPLINNLYKDWKDGDKVDKELTRIVNKDTSILSTPDFVSSDFWIASSSLFNKQKGKHQSCTMHPNNESNIKMQYTFFSLPRLLKIYLYSWYFLKKQKFNYVLPDLDSRVHVIVDIIIFQYSMSVVIKIHSNLFRDITILGGVGWRLDHIELNFEVPNLFSAVYPVPPEYRCASCGHPHSGQSVAVHLIFLYYTLALFMLQTETDSTGRVTLWPVYIVRTCLFCQQPLMYYSQFMFMLTT